MKNELELSLRDRPVICGVVLPDGMTPQLLKELSSMLNGCEDEYDTSSELAIKVYEIFRRHLG